MSQTAYNLETWDTGLAPEKTRVRACIAWRRNLGPLLLFCLKV